MSDTEEDFFLLAIAVRKSAVRVRGGLVAHPMFRGTGYMVSTAKTGFCVGGARFATLEDADKFAKRLQRFRQRWATMTLTDWRKLPQPFREKLRSIAQRCGWLNDSEMVAAAP